MKRHILSKTAPFHTLFTKKKKGSKQCCFVGTVGLLLPFDARGRGRRRFFLPLSPPSLSSKRHRLPLKKTPTNPTCPKTLSTCWRGGGGVAAHCTTPVSLPCFFAYKNRRREGWKKMKKKRERRREGEDQKKKRRRRRSREKNEKQRIEEEEGAAPLAAANHQRRCLSTPAAPPMTTTITGKPFFPFVSLFRPCMPSSVHVACEEWRALFTRVAWAQPT